MGKVQMRDIVPNADLKGGDFSGMDLTGMDMRGANLEGANFKDAKTDGLILQGANLKGVNPDDLAGADIRWASGLDDEGAAESERQEKNNHQLTEDDIGVGQGKTKVKVKAMKDPEGPKNPDAPKAENESEVILDKGFAGEQKGA